MAANWMRAAAASATAVVLLGGCGGAVRSTSHAASSTAVPFSVSDCGDQWKPTAGSAQALTLHNVGDAAGEVQVLGRDGKVYDEVENVAAGTTITVHLSLASGRYALRCQIEDQPTVVGRYVTIDGDGHGQPGIGAVSQAQLVPAAVSYQKWVSAQLPALTADVRRMRDAITAGDLSTAKRDWLTGHLAYERLGAAYGAFGTLNDRINGFDGNRPAGFHAVERDLWRHGSLGRAAADARSLGRAVGDLRRELASTEIDPGDVSLRAHEIVENTLQFQLEGTDDFGSHSDLASTAAELTGAAQVVRELAPLMKGRMSSTGLLRDIARARSVVLAAPQGVAIDRLPRLRRERVDAAVSRLCEQLAPVAATLEPRRTTQ